MEKKQPLVSVIVPVYNVEDYLAECVESLQNQTYPELEIILVDDGSTDGSGRLCDVLAAQDARIRVIHKENGGLSDARNVGMRSAEGTYFTFVDSDDVLPRNAVARMCSQCEGQGADCARSDAADVFTSGDRARSLWKVVSQDPLGETTLPQRNAV